MARLGWVWVWVCVTVVVAGVGVVGMGEEEGMWGKGMIAYEDGSGMSFEDLVATVGAERGVVVVTKFSVSVEWVDMLAVRMWNAKAHDALGSTILIPTDVASVEACKKYRWTCFVPAALVGEETLKEGITFGTKAYYEIVWMTAKVLSSILSFNHEVGVLYGDLDIVWADNPINVVRAAVAGVSHPIDYAVVCEFLVTPDLLNGGLHYIPPVSQSSIAGRAAVAELMRQWYAASIVAPEKLDQEVLRELLLLQRYAPIRKGFLCDGSLWANCMGKMPDYARSIHLTCLTDAESKYNALTDQTADFPNFLSVPIHDPACADATTSDALLDCRFSRTHSF